jgi:hypothetical protein
MKMSKKVNKEIIELGNISVDSGTMMLCDPCYIFQDEKTKSATWSDFIDRMRSNGMDGDEKGCVLNLNDHDFANGSVFSTGFGDGSYPVEIEVGDFGKWGKRVVSAKITFIDDMEK